MTGSLKKLCGQPFRDIAIYHLQMFFGVSKWYNSYNKHKPLKMLAIFLGVHNFASRNLATRNPSFLISLAGWLVFPMSRTGDCSTSYNMRSSPTTNSLKPNCIQKKIVVCHLLLLLVLFSARFWWCFLGPQWEWKVKVSSYWTRARVTPQTPQPFALVDLNAHLQKPNVKVSWGLISGGYVGVGWPAIIWGLQLFWQEEELHSLHAELVKNLATEEAKPNSSRLHDGPRNGECGPEFGGCHANLRFRI